MRETATIADRYEIKQEIGRGSAGIVHLARDPTTQREVAIKTILWPNGVTDSEREAFRQRFLSGMHGTSRVSHPGIVCVHEYGAPDGESPFIVMEYVKGPTLHELICKEGLKAEWVLSTADTLAAAVRAARHAGLVHPGLKPSSVLVREADGEVKIGDYGLPRFDAPDAGAASGTHGSQAYLSPESATGRATDVRSDLFSVSVMLYEMLCGMRPFRGNDAEALRRSILEDPVPSATKLATDLCPAFDAFFARALARDPAERFANAEGFREALERLREEQRSFWAATPAVSSTERDSWPGAIPLSDPTVDAGPAAAPSTSTVAAAPAATQASAPQPAARSATPSTASSASRSAGTAPSSGTAPAAGSPTRSASGATRQSRADGGVAGRAPAPGVAPTEKKPDGPPARGPADVRRFPAGAGDAPSPSTRRAANLLWVWGGVAAVVLFLGAVWAAWSLREDGSAGTSATASSAPASRPAAAAREADGASEEEKSLTTSSPPQPGDRLVVSGPSGSGTGATGAASPPAASGSTAKPPAGPSKSTSQPERAQKKTPAAGAAAPAEEQSSAAAATDPTPAVIDPPVEIALPAPAAVATAHLDLVVKSSFKEAALTLFVDGEEVYGAALSTDARGFTRVYKKVLGKVRENLEAGVKIAPGQHTITARVHNSAKDRTHEASVEVDLEPGAQRTLHVTAGRSLGRNLELKLD